jgi:transposase-like protein
MRAVERSFGTDDELVCPKCSKVMRLTRRGPHTEHGDVYERQTFTCRQCNHEIERSADTHGNPFLQFVAT